MDDALKQKVEKVPAAPFTTETRLHETAGHGRVLEVVLVGALEHEMPESSQLVQLAGAAAADEIGRLRPAAVVVNLIEFDYSFGNELGALFLTPYRKLSDAGGGGFAIVATGQTAASVDSLIKSGHLESLFGSPHPDMVAALANLTEVTRNQPDLPLEELADVPARNAPSGRIATRSFPVSLGLSRKGVIAHVNGPPEANGTLRAVLKVLSTHVDDETHDDLFHDSVFPHENRPCAAFNVTFLLVAVVLGLLLAASRMP